MIVDEIAAIAALVLVVVGLCDGLVGEVVVLSELENEAEAGLVEVLHPDIGQGLEGTLVAVGDHLSKRDLVLHGGEPELGDTRHVGGALGRLLVLDGSTLLFLLLLVFLASLDLLVGGLGLAVDDGGTLLVQRSELGKVLLLELQNLLLELGLELGVVLLDALKASNAALNLGGKRLDVAR